MYSGIRRLDDFCLAKYAFEAVQGAKAVTAPFVITNVVPGDYDYDGRLDMLLMGQDNPGGWWADEELHMTVHRGQGRGQFGKIPLLAAQLASADFHVTCSCTHDNTFICNTTAYAFRCARRYACRLAGFHAWRRKTAEPQSMEE